MFSQLLQDPDATKKVLETVLDSPNGKRTLSRLARTCRAVAEPALNVLWRELDSLVPIIGLFPSQILKKARRPGLGFSKTPLEQDWTNVFRYSEKVRRIAYDESSNAVVASVFPILDDCCPRTHVLPRLNELVWKVDTSAGLDRCTLFLSPEVKTITLEIGNRIPQLKNFISDMSARTQLTSFSFISPTVLPDNFHELLSRQGSLESVTLVAPGALSSVVGRWTASLPNLKNLQMDLSGRSVIAVEGFFDELGPRSGDSTPSEVGSVDSGVFSGDELDFSELRKSALRLTGDLPSKSSFAQLRKLHLTGDASNIAVFLKHVASPLAQLDIVIEDPPEKADWQDLSAIICERFGETLHTLRVSAMSSSRLFLDTIRSPIKLEPTSARLSLEHLTSLPNMTRLEIDLPESVAFTDADIESLSKACPNLEILRLCPLSRFPPNTGPKLTLESMAHIVRNCRRLHTLAIVLNAKQGNADILASRTASSRSLLRLHLGHSWITDPLQVSIFLSHIAPYMDGIKWFQEKNRPGYIEANARGWQSVAETLPHLQNIRLTERDASSVMRASLKPRTHDKGIDATVKTVSRGVHAVYRTVNASIQFSPELVNRSVEAAPVMNSTAIDATPAIRHTSIDASPPTMNQGVDVRPMTTSTAVDATVSMTSKSIETDAPLPKPGNSLIRHTHSTFLFFPSILGLFSLAYRIFIYYPLSFPSRILNLTLARFREKRTAQGIVKQITTNLALPTPSAVEEIPLVKSDSLQVRQ